MSAPKPGKFGESLEDRKKYPSPIDRLRARRERGPERRLQKKFKKRHKTENRNYHTPLIANLVIINGVVAAINRPNKPAKNIKPAKQSRPITHDMDRRSYKGWTHKHHSASAKAHKNTSEQIKSKYHDGEKWRTQLHKHAHEHHRRMVNFHTHMARKKRGLKKTADTQMTHDEYRSRYGKSKPSHLK